MLASPGVKTKLADYLARTNESHRAFAARAGFPKLYPMVSLWSRGIGRPGLEAAMAIQAATGGEIPAAYWLTVEPQARPVPARKHKRRSQGSQQRGSKARHARTLRPRRGPATN